MGAQCSNAARTAEAEEVLVGSQPAATLLVSENMKFGWKRDVPDFRDRVLALPQHKTRDLPKSMDLRPKESFPIYNQGHLGSCTANAIGAAFHFDQVKQGLFDFVPARLFIYYNEREMEGNIGEDCGAYIRDGIKTMTMYGVCPESMWPYDISVFTEKPSEECYTEGAKNLCLEYARVPQTLEDLKGCINEGFPFVFGFMVLKSFFTQEVASTGKMVMPTMYDKVLGGHAVMGIGYDDDMQCFIVRNSWGEEWGDKGYFYMPYDFITQETLASDFWAMKSIQGSEFPCRRM